jgi:tRNA (adenine22-N1)-methyltransferase
MKLTDRLLMIAQEICTGAMVADIGTDHGYIPIYLMKNRIAKKVIATDVRKGPIEIAEKNIKRYGLEGMIETRLGNGLEVIQLGEVDTIILAGMGGLLIRDILMKDLKIANSVARLILQPMVAQDELRRWLVKNGFEIINEKLVAEDHKIYEIIVARQGKQQIEEDIYYEIGLKLIENKDPLLESFIQKHIKKQNTIIKHLSQSQSEIGKIKLKECQAKIKKMEEVLKCLKNVKQ